MRVHGLANLGGLVAIAGLEAVPPDLLLGVLLEVGERLPALSPERREGLRARGEARLASRGTAKRAWRAHRAARDLHDVKLTSEQLRALLAALGAPVPEASADLPRVLSEALRKPDRRHRGR